MVSSASPKVKAGRARKSIGYLPSPDRSKENASADSAGKAASKKARSKSVGPGAIDALKEDSGNRQALPPTMLKSILKPSLLPSPTRPKANANLARSPRSSGLKSPKSPKKEGHASPQRQNALKSEEEQHAAAREREEKEAQDRKDARKKSLAKRRVSFAPEATLHCWDVVELPEDSTTSSASTNSTRRASALTSNNLSPFPRSPRSPRSSAPGSDPSEPPSTPPEQVEMAQAAVSPAHQRDLHQKKRRRSSGFPPMDFNNPDDFSSSPYSNASDETGHRTFETVDEDLDSSSSDDNDLVEEETINGVDGDDVTIQSTGELSTDSSGRLEEALRQAARQAGTQGIEYDENSELAMDVADDEITNAFKPWMKQGKYVPQVVGDPSALQDQENLNPFSPAFKANLQSNEAPNDGGMTMDFTQAGGAILPNNKPSLPSPERRRRKSMVEERRRSNAARRQSVFDGSVFGDETMDLTGVFGGIQPSDDPGPRGHTGNLTDDNEDDEEMTMELTTAMDGVLDRNNPTEQDSLLNDDHLVNQYLLSEQRRESDSSIFSAADMNFTVAAREILPTIAERTEPLEDQTMDMDIKQAVGAILPEQLNADDRTQARAMMEQETDAGQLTSKSIISQPENRAIIKHLTPVASETGSPSLAAFQTRSKLRSSGGARTSVTPKGDSRQTTPLKKPTTPSKQLTPQIPTTRPTTPGKTPPAKNVAMRTRSPKKLFKAEIKQLNSTPKPVPSNSIFHEDTTSGKATPKIVLKPQKRRSSGLGMDKEGLGSPHISALLDRRGSIGESAEKFVASDSAPSQVRFEDPQALNKELEIERLQDERRESGRGILQTEADDQEVEEPKDATTNLKDMIESLTPQKPKRKLNGRKSLHVGAAKGLLGKRPAELDDENNDSDTTPKRLKGRQGSPVKSVRLPGPPPKTETTGRITRASRLSLQETTGNGQASTPSGGLPPQNGTTTPKDQPRFKDAEARSPTIQVASFEQKLSGGLVKVPETEEAIDRIHLQDFLNMTNIRFMELTTTKRRHTVAPNGALDNSSKKRSSTAPSESLEDRSGDLESCVVAGACTVPMLELYQHSCRELKKYIFEGRSIVREIETDTFEENPPLFREYISAPSDVKAVMDNQFKNVKTHARLLSKAMWYEWRMKLLEGLKEGLVKIDEGMEEDHEVLAKEEELLQPVLPFLIDENDRLEAEVQDLQVKVDELASCDLSELEDARNDLLSTEEELEDKRKLLEDLQNVNTEVDERIDNAVEAKEECEREIIEAERVRQECRGWSPAEVALLQANVTALEKLHGWAIVSAAENTLTMTYSQTLQLYFTPTAFLGSGEEDARIGNSPISLTYIADINEHRPQPLTTERRFFLQIMRVQLQCLQQGEARIKDLLDFISSSWAKACVIAEDARSLGLHYITEATILADEVLAIRSSILLRVMKTKVDVEFKVTAHSRDGVIGINVGVRPTAKVIYGENLKEKKMCEFLEQKTSGRDAQTWIQAVRELEERLITRGKR